MKTLLYISLISFSFSFLFTSCSNKSNPVESPVPYAALTSIKGTLNNWDKGDNWVVGLMYLENRTQNDKFLSVSGIDKNGNFELTNLEAPPSGSFLNPPYYMFRTDIKTYWNKVVCSDSSALIANAHLFLKEKNDTSNDIKGAVYRNNHSDAFWFYLDSVKAGDFDTNLLYVTRDVNVTGSAKLESYDDYQKREYITTYNFNLAYKKGWNIKVVTIVSYKVRTEGGKTIIESEQNITNREPIGGRWDFSVREDESSKPLINNLPVILH